MKDDSTTPKYPDITVQLCGESGNAFSILARVRRALIDAAGAEEADAFVKEAKAGDFDHLLQTAMRWVDVS